MWEYTHARVRVPQTHTHTQTHIHMQGQFHIANPPTSLFLGGGRKPFWEVGGNLEETHKNIKTESNSGSGSNWGPWRFCRTKKIDNWLYNLLSMHLWTALDVQTLLRSRKDSHTVYFIPCLNKPLSKHKLCSAYFHFITASNYNSCKIKPHTKISVFCFCLKHDGSRSEDLWKSRFALWNKGRQFNWKCKLRSHAALPPVVWGPGWVNVNRGMCFQWGVGIRKSR